MVKSGLIIGFVALLLTAGVVLISPLCAPCLALFLGLGAGFLAGTFDKPMDNSQSAKSGALGGVIAGVGALLGQLIGGAINGAILGPQGASEILRQLGISNGADPGSYWAGLIGSACCFGILDLALMAGLGALGGILWWQISGKKNASFQQPPAL